MTNKFWDVLKDKRTAPTPAVNVIGIVLGVGAFLASAFLTSMGLAVFKDGAWVLLVFVLGVTAGCQYIAANGFQETAFTYYAWRLANSLGRGMATVLLIAAVGASVMFALNSYTDHSIEVDAEKQATYKATPEKLIEKLIGNSDIHAAFAKTGNQIAISYDLDPWSLTASTAISTFNLHIAQIIPELFGTYPDVQTIQVIGRSEFNDKRGNSSRDNAVRITFTRRNSSGINWKNVHYENIPEIADSYWIHPSAKH